MGSAWLHCAMVIPSYSCNHTLASKEHSSRIRRRSRTGALTSLTYIFMCVSKRRASDGRSSTLYSPLPGSTHQFTNIRRRTACRGSWNEQRDTDTRPTVALPVPAPIAPRCDPLWLVIVRQQKVGAGCRKRSTTRHQSYPRVIEDRVRRLEVSKLVEGLLPFPYCRRLQATRRRERGAESKKRCCRP